MTRTLAKQSDALFDTVAAGMQPEVQRSAIISDCGQYRYRLDRVWDASKPQVCFCCLNPSKADANIDDPSIIRMMGFGHSWGFGGIRVVNLFALRATDPRELPRHPAPIAHLGAHGFYDNLNDAHITRASDGLRLIVAWGRGGKLMGRDKAVLELFGKRRIECLRTNADGSPKHPLYLPSNVTPFPFGRSSK